MVIAVFENINSIKCMIKEQLYSFSIKNNIDFDIMWFDCSFEMNNLEKYVDSISIAFVSLDEKQFCNVGNTISKLNPYCYICYYSEEKNDIYSLLETRPFGYLKVDALKKSFYETLEKSYDRFIISNEHYKFSSKSSFLCIPVRNIIYFQSELKYVNIVCCLNKENRIRSTLDNVELNLNKQNLHRQFIRVHKSYLVNSDKIRYINKKDHTIEMEDGQILPISTSKYNDVMGCFNE